jgi:hypothetical protein
VLLPPVADQTEPGSAAERDLFAQAVVLRSAVILRTQLSNDIWWLRGYEVEGGEGTARFLRPDLRPKTDQRRPVEQDHLSAVQSIAVEVVPDQLAGQILASIVGDLRRGFDLYRSWGRAMHTVLPQLQERSDWNALLPILDASVLPTHDYDQDDRNAVGDLGRILRRLHLGGQP